MTQRVVVPREVVERLRDLSLASRQAEAEATGILLACRALLPLDAEVIGWDDGEEPALLLADTDTG